MHQPLKFGAKRRSLAHRGGVRVRLMPDLQTSSSGMARSAVMRRGLAGQMPVGEPTDMQMAWLLETRGD